MILNQTSNQMVFDKSHLTNVTRPADYAGNVDDAASKLLLLHQAGCLLGHQKRPLQVDIDHLYSLLSPSSLIIILKSRDTY